MAIMKKKSKKFNKAGWPTIEQILKRLPSERKVKFYLKNGLLTNGFKPAASLLEDIQKNNPDLLKTKIGALRRSAEGLTYSETGAFQKTSAKEEEAVEVTA